MLCTSGPPLYSIFTGGHFLKLSWDPPPLMWHLVGETCDQLHMLCTCWALRQGGYFINLDWDPSGGKRLGKPFTIYWGYALTMNFAPLCLTRGTFLNFANIPHVIISLESPVHTYLYNAASMLLPQIIILLQGSCQCFIWFKTFFSCFFTTFCSVCTQLSLDDYVHNGGSIQYYEIAYKLENPK